MLTTPQAVRVVNGYRTSLNRLHGGLGRRAAQAWTAADGDERAWARHSASLALAGRRQATLATVAMTSSLLQDTVTVPVDEIVAAGAVDLWAYPLSRFAEDVAAGMPLVDAMAAGRTRAASAAATDVTQAARATATEIDRGEERIVGYRRTLSPRACRWCATLTTQLYRSAESASAPNHDGNCHCAVVPVVGDLDPGRVINRPLLDAVKETDSAYLTATGAPAARPDANPTE